MMIPKKVTHRTRRRKICGVQMTAAAAVKMMSQRKHINVKRMAIIMDRHQVKRVMG